MTSGRIKLFGGKILIAGGKIATHDDCCLAPGNCPDAAMFYRIADYANDLFDASGCTSCNASANPPWNGEFYWWLACQWVGVGSPSGSIDGKQSPGAAVGLVLGPPNYWVLAAICGTVESQHLIWVGTKYIGATPAGLYWRNTIVYPTQCGDGPSSLVVEIRP